LFAGGDFKRVLKGYFDLKMDAWIVRLMKAVFVLFLTLLVVVMLTGTVKFIGIAFGQSTAKEIETHVVNIVQMLSGLATVATLAFLIKVWRSDKREKKSEDALKIIQESIQVFEQNLKSSNRDINYPRLYSRIFLFKENKLAYKSLNKLESSFLLDDIDWTVDRICERFLADMSLKDVMNSHFFCTDECYGGVEFEKLQEDLRPVLNAINDPEIEEHLLKLAYQLRFTIRQKSVFPPRVFGIFGAGFARPTEVFHGLHSAEVYYTRTGVVNAKAVRNKDDVSILNIAYYYASIGSAELAAGKLVYSNFMDIKSLIAK